MREFLEQRGCPANVVRDGLPGLIAAWEKTAGEIEAGYALGLDDYLNDMDGRELIALAWKHAAPATRRSLAGRLAAVDDRVRAVVQAVPRCLWGDKVAKLEGWSAEENWWYFSVPKRPGRHLHDDLGLHSKPR